MQKSSLYLVAVVLIAIGFVFQLFVQPETKKVIITGTGNPGKILIYSFEKGDYARTQIDTGYNLVWTVKVGDIYNNGKNVIVAGVGNSFFATPYGCQLVAYEPLMIGWKKTVIDSNVDLRCKDVAIGDADNDGMNELVLGTHGEGTINIYKWNGAKWDKIEIERNFIEQVDKQESSNHRVPVEKLTYNTVVQTAIHIVKIGDAYNEGKNVIVATESSALEYTEGPQISFVNLYKFDDKNWIREVIHNGTGFQHRSVLIDNLDYSGRNKIAIGAAPNRLFLLDNDGKWSSILIFNQTLDKNMKGLDFQDIYSSGRKTIVLATGIPYALIFSLEWDGNRFNEKLIGNVSQVLEKYNVIKNLNYNSLDVQAADIDNDNKMEIIVAGEADTSLNLGKLKPDDNVFGWESTPLGFLIVYKNYEERWTPQILDTYSVLALTVNELQV